SWQGAIGRADGAFFDNKAAVELQDKQQHAEEGPRERDRPSVRFLESLHEPENKSRIVTRIAGLPASYPSSLKQTTPTLGVQPSEARSASEVFRRGQRGQDQCGQAT